MSRHVDHLLAAYVERQLRPEQAARVYQHVLECSGCWDKLIRHERLTDELRIIGQWPTLRPAQIRHMWLAASAVPIAPMHKQSAGILLPLLLSLLLLLMPFTAGVNNMMPSTALAATASHSPGETTAQTSPGLLSVRGIPLPNSQNNHLMLAATPPVSGMPLAIEPVPLAPSRP